MDHTPGGGNRDEAERWCSIAGKLLEARDLVGCKKFAERAMDADPLLDGVDQIVAAADVILASQRRINNHLDYYSVLQLKPSSSGPDLASIKASYRRLALLLHPDKNRFPSAAQAFRLVSDAWAFLSDPTKKSLYDDEIKIAAHLRSNGSEKVSGNASDSPATPPPPAFWTMCPGCFRAYEYEKRYLDQNLRCQNCRKAFLATELPSQPPVVPGAEMYYCSWGVFPLGFPGAPAFNGVAIPEGTPLFQAFPSNPSPPPPAADTGGGGNATAAKTTPPKVASTGRPRGRPKGSGSGSKANMSSGKSNAGRPKKVQAKKPKKVADAGSPSPSQQMEMLFGGEPEIQDQMKDTGYKAGVSENAGDFAGGFDMNTFSIDLDANAEVLGNLANLPFLKDDEIVIMR